jgi:hypothetical protein
MGFGFGATSEKQKGAAAFIQQPRLLSNHLLLREDVPEDQEGHEANESTISEGGDE